MSQETWKAIPNYEGVYEVSDQGRVRSVGKRQGARPGYVLKSSYSSGGYLQIMLRDTPRRQMFKVHVLVMVAFSTRPSPSHEVNHKNGNREDNRLDNLEWVTRTENVRHAYSVLGRINPIRGERHPKAKLTFSLAASIRLDYATGQYSHVKLAAKYGVSNCTICAVVNNQRWVDAA